MKDLNGTLIIKLYKMQVMCLASARKRKALWDKGEAEKMQIIIEGHKITEMEFGIVLGLT